jgi:diguanylate cyclase (GGDEF)-like protein/PAS domain S-box-containing protein
MIPEDPASHPADGPGGDMSLAAQLAMYRLMVENVADVISRGDAALRRSYVSPAARQVLGYEPAELLGRSGFDLVHPDDAGRVRQSIEKLGPDHPLLSLDFRMRRKDGTYIWVEGRYRHIPEDGGVLAVMRDITARKTAEALLAEANEKLADANLALQALVHRDGLTGLANRRCFDNKLAEEFRRAFRQELPLALVLLDLDEFKAFNDRHGHLAGDECLRQISRVVEGALCRPGDLAARYGGEEIAVLLPATDGAGAALIAEKIREAVVTLGIPNPGSSHGVATVSAGAASVLPGSDEDDPAELIEAADRALYLAKAAGRNQVRAASLDAPAYAVSRAISASI